MTDQTNWLSSSTERWAQVMRGTRNYQEFADDDVSIADTPKKEVLCIDKMRLYRYEPLAPRKQSTPLLIVYSLIGRYTMMDLQADRSVVRNLLEAGIEVYMVDWGEPGRADKYLRFEDYVLDYVASCVDYICDAEDTDQCAVLGVCEGGVFTSCYAALNPERVSHLALAVTPIDFHADQSEPHMLENGFLNRWARNMDREDIDNLIDAFGFLPGQLTGLIFQEMTPVKTMVKYNWELPDALSGSPDQVMNFLRMEKWLSDRPHHPSEAAKQWLNELYRENRLARGEFYLDGQRIDLTRLNMPMLNIFAAKDHIIPAPTSRALKHLVGTEDYTELELPAGHIGTFVSRKANRLFSDTLAEWLDARTATQSSCQSSGSTTAEAAI